MESGRAHERGAHAAKQREEIRKRSKALFGNRDRLEVMAAIAASRDGLVCAADLERSVGLANNRVRAQLIALYEAGLLQAMPRSRDRIQWYQRQPSRLWQAAVDVYTEWNR